MKVRFLFLLPALLLAMTGAEAPAASHPLVTAVVDPVTFSGRGAAIAFAHVHEAGATAARLSIDWRQVAPRPGYSRRPPGFVATDPASPWYRWQYFDAQVRLAADNGLEPVVTLTGAPRWALRPDPRADGLGRPDPTEYGAFVRAAARRYDGASRDLPRVRYWQIWNEPNHPGRSALKAGAASWYRDLVNKAAAAAHGIDPDNVVIAGGTSPYTTNTAVAPLAFMRQLLCISGIEAPRPTCDRKIHFDVWAHHPYTSGAPTSHAASGDDVAVADLPKMRKLLLAAVKLGHVVSEAPVRFWVTEFSWDTNPPDPRGVPLALQSRWIAEALYRMWHAGVSLVAWWRIRDDPLNVSFYQSGLYFRGASISRDAPKRSFHAFRFPLVAFADRGKVQVWGRTPGSDAGEVVLEQTFDGGWRTLAKVTSDDDGILAGTYKASAVGSVRARLASTGEVSLPFSLTRPPDDVRYPRFGS